MPAHHASKRALTADTGPRGLRVPLVAGAVIGVAQTATPFAFWWLTPATVYAIGLVFIAAVYIGFSVTDGRWKVIATETTVAAVFVGVAASAITGSAWLLVVGFTGHGLKDFWQPHRVCHRHPMVAAILRSRGLRRGRHPRNCVSRGCKLSLKPPAVSACERLSARLPVIRELIRDTCLPPDVRHQDRADRGMSGRVVCMLSVASS